MELLPQKNSLRDSLEDNWAQTMGLAQQAVMPRKVAFHDPKAPAPQQLPVSPDQFTNMNVPGVPSTGGMPQQNIGDLVRALQRPNQQPGLVQEMVPGQFSTVNPAYG